MGSITRSAYVMGPAEATGDQPVPLQLCGRLPRHFNHLYHRDEELRGEIYLSFSEQDVVHFWAQPLHKDRGRALLTRTQPSLSRRRIPRRAL
ncbi:unnamed protein product, partial [Mesorhabditis belari]|uniref:Uncharacterized protein n=1 Tax=Mesorhabditis belari TaxID=2138241 RepID=A0AAF3F080_9BILA